MIQTCEGGRDQLQAAAGWGVGAEATAAAADGVFFFAAAFLRLRYFLRRCRFSALLYCLLIGSLLFQTNPLFMAL